MPRRDSKPQGSGRVRLLTFRFLALTLLTLSMIGLGVVAVGAYLSVARGPSGRAALVTVGFLGAAVGLLVVVSIRALRVRSVDELEDPSKSRILDEIQLETRDEPYT